MTMLGKRARAMPGTVPALLDDPLPVAAAPGFRVAAARPATWPGGVRRAAAPSLAAVRECERARKLSGALTGRCGHMTAPRAPLHGVTAPRAPLHGVTAPRAPLHGVRE